MPRDERHTATIPYGTLGIVPLKSCSKMGDKLMITLYNGENKENMRISLILLLADTKETAML
mgnify:CR=1 FL=1